MNRFISDTCTHYFEITDLKGEMTGLAVTCRPAKKKQSKSYPSILVINLLPFKAVKLYHYMTLL